MLLQDDQQALLVVLHTITTLKDAESYSGPPHLEEIGTCFETNLQYIKTAVVVKRQRQPIIGTKEYMLLANSLCGLQKKKTCTN